MRMKQMNAANLYEQLYDRLKKVDGLTKMYIGRTKDLSDAISRHQAEGYNYTVEIAYGDVETIREGEIFLIRKFKESDLTSMNDHDGGGPNESTKLYVSYSCNPLYSTMHDLENGELDWEVVELVK